MVKVSTRQSLKTLLFGCACVFLIVAMASGAPRRGFDYRGVASGTRARDDGRIASETRARDDGATRQPRRQLLSTPGVLLNAIIQPTTFLRVALLILRNQLGNNPAQDFLQMVLTTDLGYTKFTNVFASFAAGVIQDFSSGVTSDAVLNQEWVIDGTSTLDNSVFSEFLYGGAVGIEQFFGWGFEVSSSAAMAIQQSLQPKDDRSYEVDYQADDVTGSSSARRRRLLTANEAKSRKLPKGAEVILQTQHPLNGDMFRRAAAKALNRTRRGRAEDEAEAEEDARGRRLLQQTEVVDVTYDDVELMTTNWFESFPATLPLAIRDRFIALLEEYIVDPQIRISLDITVALVGTATPGVGITAAEIAADNTISNQIVFHGYDAAIDFASSIDPAVAIAGTVSKGVAIANAITDATEIIDAVTNIIDQVNVILEDDLAARQSGVSAQGGSNGNMTLTERVSQYIRPLGNRTGAAGPRGVDTSRATHFTGIGQAENVTQDARAEGDGTDYSVPYDYEPLGAVSGTYAMSISLIFLEQIALNGGSITVI